MKLRRWQAIVALAAFLAAAPDVRAQRTQQDPHIGYVYPAGGRPGTSFEVTVGGQYLGGVTEAHVSGGGVRLTVTESRKPLTQGEFNALRMKLDEARACLQEERKKSPASGKREPLTPAKIARAAGVTDAQLEAMAEYRRRQADPKRQPNPQIAEEVRLQVRLAADARPGQRELRLIAPSGMSNPVYFHVGQLTEYREHEPNDKTPDTGITDLPVIINGQIMPGDVDRFSFQARKGARLVAAASARELVPYLADAVPGWFQAVLALYDAKGNEVAYADSFGFRQDPVLYHEIPEDGDYAIEIRDSLYRGREDFVYRIALGELPYVTGIFPLGGCGGTQVTTALQGWNLPVDKLKVDAYFDRGRPIRSVFVRQKEQISNRVPFAVDMLPECLEQEPNDQPESAQAVKLPIIVNGHIDPRGDCDVFRFEGRARDNVVAEVHARRLGSPLDSLLRLTDADGRELAANDDYEDKGAALLTHHADSRISAVLPAGGTYYLRLSDAQRKGGAEYAYRVHIRPPRPDFELRVVPSSVIARAGSTVPVTVYALRRDGFSDDITLELEKAPAGFKLSGAWVPANQDKIRLTLTVPSSPTEEPVNLQLEGHSQTRGRKISHLAVPAEAMMQAFAYQHLVPAKDWTVAVTPRGGAKPVVQFVKEERLKLPAGGTAPLRVSVSAKSPGEIRFELSEPPDGITIESVSSDSSGLAILVRADAAKAKPGLKGNLIFNAFSERSANSADKKPQAKRQRTPLGTLPAVSFEVVKP